MRFIPEDLESEKTTIPKFMTRLPCNASLEISPKFDKLLPVVIREEKM